MRKGKPPKPTSEQLAAVLRDRNRFHRIDAFQAYSLHEPNIEDLPTLRNALHDPEFMVSNWSAVSIGKLGTRAVEAVDDLIATATAPWEYGCPQRFCESIAALVRVAPQDPRLVETIQAALPCSNYGVLKAGVNALAKIGTPEALNTIRWLDQYWGAARKDKSVDEFIQRMLERLTGTPYWSGVAGFVAYHGALFVRLENGSYRTTAYCPKCKGAMTSLKGIVPYKCFECGSNADFSAREMKTVMNDLA